MSGLSPNLQYRIQNVEYATYLELPGKVSNSEVKTRILKNSEKQLWKAVVDSSNSDLYMFENVGQNTWLGIVTDGKEFSQLVSKNKQNASKWWLDKNGDIYQISLADSTSSLQLGDFGIIYIKKRNYNNTQKWRFLTQAQVAQWEISHTNKPVPDGQYRIRNLNGFALLTFPEENATAPKPTTVHVTTNLDPDSLLQKWSATRNDDGTYTIENSTPGQGHFLGCETYELGKYGKVHGMQTKFSWQLSCIGGLAYTMNVDAPSGLLAAGFQNYQADIGQPVVLMPSNGAYSQIWVFETWDKADFGSGKLSKRFRATQNFTTEKSGEQDKSENTDSESADSTSSLAEGHYFIKNIGLDTYIHTESTVSLKDKATGSPARYFVRFESNNMEMVPHSYPGNQSLYWKDSESKVEVAKKNEYAWSISPTQGNKRAFYISKAESSSGKVLSAKDETIEMIDKATNDSDSKQLWEFVVVF